MPNYLSIFDTSWRRNFALLGVTCLFLVPSFDTINKYFGLLGIVGYCMFGVPAILFAYQKILPSFLAKLDERKSFLLACLTLVFLIVFAAILYPVANSGIVGPGGDADDALIIGASDLLNGLYPYYKHTYLGGSLSPMPGTIILSVPFVLFNILPFQNVFWMTILFLSARKIFKSSTLALGLIWTALAFSPTVYQGLATGSDHISNSIYVTVGIWFLVRNAADPGSSSLQKIFPVLLLGIGLSSRSNFLLVLPLVFSALFQHGGLRSAITYVASTLGVTLAVTVPFWLYDPAGFSPFIVQSTKMAVLESVLPYARFIIPASSIFLASILALQKMDLDGATLFRNCAVVQLFVLLFTSIISCIEQGELNLFMGTSGYGMFTLFFAVVSIWIGIAKIQQQQLASERV